MQKKTMYCIVLLLLVFGFYGLGYAATVPAPDQGGDGFNAVTLENAKKLHEQGAVFIACHSHTTDFMKGRPPGTIYITCMVPKDHKRTDMPLGQVEFDVSLLPEDKNTPIITYCASNT
ncbi:MAG: hypothetical protein U5K27_20990 [Desulfotignum sp.]|nr:hypothetical protein [Desulfotignum sp.]